jgi:hypothetical protein
LFRAEIKTNPKQAKVVLAKVSTWWATPHFLFNIKARPTDTILDLSRHGHLGPVAYNVFNLHFKFADYIIKMYQVLKIKFKDFSYFLKEFFQNSRTFRAHYEYYGFKKFSKFKDFLRLYEPCQTYLCICGT